MDNTYYGGEDIYSDGSIEDEILEIVKSTPESGYDDVIKEKDNWPILYHLSAQRENIVRQLTRLGDTCYEAAGLDIPEGFDYFIPNSQLSELRRLLVEKLNQREGAKPNGSMP